jgi:FtsP/CotA-like multicopper oxidase with cupredoxin domain
MDRRTFIQAALSNFGALALGARLPSTLLGMQASPRQESTTGQSNSPLAITGTPREINLIAEPTQFELPSRGVFEKWLYNGQYPGPEIRVKEGERLRLKVSNKLPESTTIHWHGIPVPNAMDGVPDVTQPPISPGGTFVYEFDARPSGSFMYHSHFGLQPERGLVGPLIVEEKKPHIAYDREYTLVLTDFLAGAPAPLGRTPNDARGMIAMQMPPYVALLINGRPPEAPAVFNVKTGERVRLRLINPSGATIYRFAIGGHPVTVSHADGRPVIPFRVDALHIGPGERYDILVDAKSPGAWPIAAAPDNDLPPARAVLRYEDSNESRPREGALPEGLTGGRMLELGDLRGLDLPEPRKPNRIFNLVLSGGTLKSGGMMSSGGMLSPEWTINGQAYPNAAPLEIHQGEAVRFRIVNESSMVHPMHLHGHFFRVGNVIKDTAIVWADTGRAELNFVADNAGKWFFHCHNLYHMEAGMTRLIRYV